MNLLVLLISVTLTVYSSICKIDVVRESVYYSPGVSNVRKKNNAATQNKYYSP